LSETLNKQWIMLAALLGVCPAPVMGGLVFFDNFDGNALAPHWLQPPPSEWLHHRESTTSQSRGQARRLIFP
jgi:hypothetical protein